MVSGLAKLWKNGISTRFALLPTFRQVGDIREAKSRLKKVEKDALTLEHIRKTHGDQNVE
jgi:hypothetical protein